MERSLPPTVVSTLTPFALTPYDGDTIGPRGLKAPDRQRVLAKLRTQTALSPDQLAMTEWMLADIGRDIIIWHGVWLIPDLAMLLFCAWNVLMCFTSGQRASIAGSAVVGLLVLTNPAAAQSTLPASGPTTREILSVEEQKMRMQSALTLLKEGKRTTTTRPSFEFFNDRSGKSQDLFRLGPIPRLRNLAKSGRSSGL